MIDPGTGEILFDELSGVEIRDPVEIEAEVEWIRTRLTGTPVAGQIKSPDDIVTDLEWAKHNAARAAVVIRDADRAHRTLKRLWDRRYVVAIKGATAKAADERAAQVRVALEDYVLMLDAAEIALEYAKRVAKTIEGTTSAIQTQSKMVETTYQLAGKGRS